jgi:hypothetical protein
MTAGLLLLWPESWGDQFRMWSEVGMLLACLLCAGLAPQNVVDSCLTDDDRWWWGGGFDVEVLGLGGMWVGEVDDGMMGL